jgi:hypothetical protein
MPNELLAYGISCCPALFSRHVAKLQEKDSQLFSLKADYAKLQGELVEIAKAATATKQAPKRTTKTPPKKAAE